MSPHPAGSAMYFADLIGQSNPEQTRSVVVDVRNAGERDSGTVNEFAGR